MKMDGNYEIKQLDFTLKNMSAMKIIHQILMNCGIISATEQNKEAVVVCAIEKAKKLNLTELNLGFVFGLFRPVVLDMVRFYRDVFHIPVNPVYTPQGPVDLIKSTEVIIQDQDIGMVFRFIIACEFCHVKQIIELLGQMNTQEIAMIEQGTLAFLYKDQHQTPSMLSGSWLEVYQSYATLMHLEDQYVMQYIHDKLLWIALNSSNNVSMRYFLENASPEALSCVLSEISQQKFLHYDKLLPDTICCVFSKLDEDQKESNWGLFTVKVLDELLKWPYQTLFIEVLRKVVLRLGVQFYSMVLASITRVIRELHNDFDYTTLFIESWTLGVNYWTTLYIRIRDLSYHFFDAFMTLDKSIIEFVIATVPDNFKAIQLSRFGDSRHCEIMFLNENYDIIKFIIRKYALNNRDAILGFRYSFVTRFFAPPMGIWCNKYIPITTRVALSLRLDEIVNELLLDANIFLT